MAVIGITGPTGSGKTTALRVLTDRGFRVVDCDRLYDRLLETDRDLRRGLEAAFGPVFLPDGSLDRRALAARSSPTRRSWKSSTRWSTRR